MSTRLQLDHVRAKWTTFYAALSGLAGMTYLATSSLRLGPVLIGLLALLFSTGILLSKLEVADDHLVIRNLWRTLRIPLEDFVEIRVQQSNRAMESYEAVSADRSTVQVNAMLSMKPMLFAQHPTERCEALSARIRELAET